MTDEDSTEENLAAWQVQLDLNRSFFEACRQFAADIAAIGAEQDAGRLAVEDILTVAFEPGHGTGLEKDMLERLEWRLAKIERDPDLSQAVASYGDYVEGFREYLSGRQKPRPPRFTVIEGGKSHDNGLGTEGPTPARDRVSLTMIEGGKNEDDCPWRRT